MKPYQKSDKKTLKKYRLVILDEKTFEEKLSLRISRLRVVLFFWSFSVLLVALTIGVLIFTPVQYYLPGVSTPKVRKQFISYMEQIDSVYKEMELNERYLKSLKNVLTSHNFSEEVNETENQNPKIEKTTFEDIELLEEDIELRKEIDSIEQAALNTKSIYENMLTTVYSPMDGKAFFSGNEDFKIEKSYEGVDLYAPSRTPIKAIMGGTVIYSNKSPNLSSQIIILAHDNGLLSLYKFATNSLKKKGDIVAPGEVMATSTVSVDEEGNPLPSLHFELWFNGMPLDPSDVINLD